MSGESMGEAKARRIAAERRLIESLSNFAPALAGKFVCPLCLKSYPPRSDDGATEAHIVPVSAEGRRATLLCKSCNSHCGTHYDKWLGEHVWTRKNGLPLFQGPTKPRQFSLNGIQFGGDIRSWSNDKIEIDIVQPRTAPANLEAALGALSVGGEISLDFSVPILRRKKEVRLGAMSTGFLALFSIFGYAWAFQSHLSTVREQLLLTPREAEDPKTVFSVNGGPFPLRIGVTKLCASRHTIFVVVGDFVVLFPAYGDDATFYEDVIMEDEFRLSFRELHIAPLPTIANAGLIVEDALIIWPDIAPGGYGPIPILYADKSSGKIQLISPLDESQYVKLLSSDAHIQHLKIDAPRKPPAASPD